jgi:chorismate mutase
VDRIDLKILHLLQRRTELSRRIGDLKRRHGALVYVPERERELLQRVARLSRGKLNSQAARAIFREILSSSRAEQGQAPIGCLSAGAGAVMAAARWCFGACDRFAPRRTWRALSRGLEDDSLVLVLLTGADMRDVLATPAGRRTLAERFVVVGDFPLARPPAGLAERVFVVMPRLPAGEGIGNRLLILIECKTHADRVKRWLHSMIDSSFHVEEVTLSPRAASRARLVRVALDKPRRALELTATLRAGGVAFAVVGVYQALEDDAG